MKLTRRNAIFGSVLACVMPARKRDETQGGVDFGRGRSGIICTRVELTGAYLHTREVAFYERTEGFSERECSELMIERAPGAAGILRMTWGEPKVRFVPSMTLRDLIRKLT
jgi:hypothetical protein